MKKFIFTLLLIGLGSTQCVWAQSQVITFATEATYPPFVFIKPNGKMAGFGADVVHALCKQMGKFCKLINAPWESLIPSLKLGKYDIIFGGMAITAKREQVVSFSKPYYQSTVTFVVKKNHHFSLSGASLKGKIIGVQGGTTFQNYLHSTYGNAITIKPYASNMMALMDLKEERLDAVFLDMPVAKLWLKKVGKAEFTTFGNIHNTQFFGQGDGFAVKKGNKKLLAVINHAISNIKSNGVYQKIINKWFGTKS